MGAPFSSPEAEVAALRAENARLRRLLDLTPEQARPARCHADGAVPRPSWSGDRVVVRAGQGAVLPHAVRRPHRRVRDPVGERADGPFGVVACGRGRVAEGHEPAVSALDGPGGRSAPDRRGPPRPVPATDRGRLPLACGGLRRAVRDARRVGLSQGGPGSRGSGGVGGVTVRDRGPCLDLLCRPGTRRGRSSTRLRPAAGGDRAARADEPDRL